MPSFFKKALGVFVEFEDTPAVESEATSHTPPAVMRQETASLSQTPSSSIRTELSKEEVNKFEKHFSSLLEQSNMPGPDYFEFFKMMETLEAHIPDERARYAAVFASLSIQGLTKDKLLESANHYAQIVEKDGVQFHEAVELKNKKEILARQQEIKELESKVQHHSTQIQRMTQEIAEYQAKISLLSKESVAEQQKIEINSSAYRIANKAIMTKIETDRQKIQTLL